MRLMLIDVGNTRIKLRDSSGKVSAISHGGVLDGLVSILPEKRNGSVHVSSVASEEFNLTLAVELKKAGYSDVFFAEVASQSLGVKCGYDQLNKLGIDRWLGVVAAYREIKDSVVVVDAGSAITIDLVDREGYHLGGYIQQGLNMSVRNLSRGTMASHMELESISGCESVEPGRNTRDAVERGAVLAAVGAIGCAMTRLGTGERGVVVTGGDGKRISSALMSLMGVSCVYRRDLVLDGLALLVVGGCES